MRVLVVDDEPIIRMDLREMLLGFGLQVVGEAGDGLSALNLARSLRPDVVLMDVKMPGEMDGIACARRILEEGICPVVLLSAYSQRELLEEASSMVGLCGYLVKPVKEEDVLVTLRLAVSRWNALSRLREENDRLKGVLEERKLLERARGVLSERFGISQGEALALLERACEVWGVSLLQAARNVLLEDEMTRGLSLGCSNKPGRRRR